MIVKGISTRCQDEARVRIKEAASALCGATSFVYRVTQVRDISSGKKYVYLKIDEAQGVELEKAVDLLHKIREKAGDLRFAARLIGTRGEQRMVYL